MPSLFESLTGLLDKGDTFDKIAGLVGGDKTQSKKAVETAAPALFSGLADKAAQPGGAKAITDMLDSADDSILDGIGDFFKDNKSDAGNGILDGIFGSNRDDLVSSLASKSGLSGGIFGKLLPMLAPLVMGVLGKRRKDDKLDSDGVASLLAAEKADLEKQGMWGSASTKAKAATAGAAVTGAGKSAKKVASSAKDKASKAADDTKDKAKDKTDSAKKAVASKTNYIDDDKASLGWLWWVLGAILLIAGLAFLVRQCSDDEETDAEGTTTTVSVTTTEVPVVTIDPESVIDIQARVDEVVPGSIVAVDGSELLAVVGEDGKVTLTGTVADQDAAEAVETAAGEVEGVVAVINDIVIEGEEVAPPTTVEVEETTTTENNGGEDSLNADIGLENIEFEYNSAQLTSAGQATLNKVVEAMGNEKYADAKFEVQGHTDDSGPEDGNQNLSERRANSAREYLVNNGVDADRLTARGYGESQPAVPHGEAGAAEVNRRVVFIQQ